MTKIQKLKVGSAKNVQVGNHNTQQTVDVSYAVVLRRLAKDIEDADVSPDEKRTWLTVLNQIAKHPLALKAVDVVGAVAAAVAKAGA